MRVRGNPIVSAQPCATRLAGRDAYRSEPARPAGRTPIREAGGCRSLLRNAFGFLEVDLTAYAIEQASAAFAGVLFGLMSAGSALGGVAYGSRGWHFPLARQFAAALAHTALGLAILALRWQPWVFAALSVVAGIAIAPALIIQSVLVTKNARGAFHRGLHLDYKRAPRRGRNRPYRWRDDARVAAGVSRARRRRRGRAWRGSRRAVLAKPLVFRACDRAAPLAPAEVAGRGWRRARRASAAPLSRLRHRHGSGPRSGLPSSSRGRPS
jgi:hypothetical protein